MDYNFLFLYLQCSDGNFEVRSICEMVFNAIVFKNASTKYKTFSLPLTEGIALSAPLVGRRLWVTQLNQIYCRCCFSAPGLTVTVQDLSDLGPGAWAS